MERRQCFRESPQSCPRPRGRRTKPATPVAAALIARPVAIGKGLDAFKTSTGCETLDELRQGTVGFTQYEIVDFRMSHGFVGINAGMSAPGENGQPGAIPKAPYPFHGGVKAVGCKREAQHGRRKCLDSRQSVFEGKAFGYHVDQLHFDASPFQYRGNGKKACRGDMPHVPLSGLTFREVPIQLARCKD